MSLFALIYVSRSTEPPAIAYVTVEKIVAAARSRNLQFGLTGALLFTGEHFAQVFEGPVESIDYMMEKVIQDQRHHQVTIVAREPISARRFGQWSMAYSGPSQFVAGHVTRLLTNAATPEHGRSANWLNDLMWEFAEGSGVT